VGLDVTRTAGLGAADQQAFASALQTINTVRAWSPAIHRCFPADERKAIVETHLELRKAGLPNDVIVGHVLPSTFAPPWVESPEEIEAHEYARAREQELERERQRQYRAALGIPVGPMPRGGGLMNAAAFGVGNLNI
jgi:hypothetical protein